MDSGSQRSQSSTVMGLVANVGNTTQMNKDHERSVFWFHHVSHVIQYVHVYMIFLYVMLSYVVYYSVYLMFRRRRS